MRILFAVMLGLSFAPVAAAQKTISFPTEDGGVVFADSYGAGERAVVLAHGGRFNKESWAKQARTLAAASFRVLALDFRGYGKSQGPGDSEPMNAPLHLDVLAAVRYLRTNGAKTVSIVGGSMGGGAGADACISSRPGEIDRVVLLGPTQTVRQRSSSALRFSWWRATTPAAMDHGSPGFARIMRGPPNRNSWSSLRGQPMRSISSRRIRQNV